ncbi:MAG: flagellar motor protein MotB [Deltaproteobacteria bacterium]|nr:flagellar motor protein MotB [Deltaproteobacteria bacterium]
MDWERFDGIPIEAAQGNIAQVNKGEHPGFVSMEEMFQRERPPRHLQWQIPWSDLMMTMFILFAVMYVYASSKQTVATPEGKERAPSIASVYELSKSTVQENHLEKLASVELVPDKAVRILLTSDLLFDTGRAALKGGSIEMLKKVATVLRRTPYLVNLVGHTDDIPIHTESFPSNWELSTARACAVARFLIEEMKIPAERCRVSGYAEYRPLRPNVSPENRAVNRRVEITITKETS